MIHRLSQCQGFQWDEGNTEKNWLSHQVSRVEAEQVFFNRPLVVTEGEQRAEHVARYYALGQTDTGRQLFIVFTIRDSERIRVISARPMSRRERRVYEHAKEKTAEADSDV
jgi:uncharacterized DUF497 family protein